MIKYKKRLKYKYIMVEDYVYQTTGLTIPADADLDLLKISTNGLLEIRRDYSWDGPSGPTFDTKNFMRGSLVHDALYQFMREQRLDQDQRKRADEILYEICVDAGMPRFAARLVYWAVRLFGAGSARPDTAEAP